MKTPPPPRNASASRRGGRRTASEPSLAQAAAPADQPQGMTVAELAEKSGVSVRNIRAYQTAGLLPPPTLHGRLGLYSHKHLSRLELIREMRHMGFGLEAISDMLGQIPKGAGAQYSLLAQMFSNGFFQVEQPQRKSLRELTAHWGEQATQAQLDRLLQSGLYRAVDHPTDNSTLAGDALFDMLSPALWDIGKQMAELNVPLDTVLDMQDTLIQHTRAIARGIVDQFVVVMVREVVKSGHAPTSLVDEHGNPGLPPALLRTVREVIARLRPLAIGSVSAAFPVVLQQEFDRDVLELIHKRLEQQTEPPAQAQAQAPAQGPSL